MQIKFNTMFFWLFSMAGSTVSRATRDRSNRLHIPKRKMFSFIIFNSGHGEQFYVVFGTRHVILESQRK